MGKVDVPSYVLGDIAVSPDEGRRGDFASYAAQGAWWGQVASSGTGVMLVGSPRIWGYFGWMNGWTGVTDL